jgi:hypothetical protein
VRGWSVVESGAEQVAAHLLYEARGHQGSVECVAGNASGDHVSELRLGESGVRSLNRVSE